MTSNTVQVAKQVASLHRSIFQAYTDNEVFNPTISVTQTNDPDSANAFVIYEPTFDYSVAPVAGKHAYTAVISEQVKRGLAVWNQCDLVVQSLLPWLKARMSDSLPGARVDWLSIDIAPRFVFRYPGADIDTDPAHSAFLVTLPGDSGQYVVDYTIEQFGYGRDCWFLPFEEYMNMTQDGNWYIYEYEEQLVVLQDLFRREHVAGQAAMNKICDQLEWVALMEMDESASTAVIDEMACSVLHEQNRPQKRAYA
jgi:hypothetical protein